jgi:hypothetical protein
VTATAVYMVAQGSPSDMLPALALFGGCALLPTLGVGLILASGKRPRREYWAVTVAFYVAATFSRAFGGSVGRLLGDTGLSIILGTFVLVSLLLGAFSIVYALWPTGKR